MDTPFGILQPHENSLRSSLCVVKHPLPRVFWFMHNQEFLAFTTYAEHKDVHLHVEISGTLCIAKFVNSFPIRIVRVGKT